jgi:hypothetical protein
MNATVIHNEHTARTGIWVCERHLYQTIVSKRQHNKELYKYNEFLDEFVETVTIVERALISGSERSMII